MKRRDFLQSGAGMALASGVASLARGDANDRLRIAVLGVNGRGWGHVNTLMGLAAKNVQVALLCDPDEKVLQRRSAEFEKKYGVKVETATDLRKVFERKDIDAVTIATPNHWHALATIWACQAGKDVYVEKPGSHTLVEGRKMIEAATKYGRIVQHGVQLRSSPALQEAVQKLRQGVIGEVYLARGLVLNSRPSIGNVADSAPAATLDWNLWQGPAQERTFSERYVHYNWHWHWDYGDGDIGNQGIHETDMCLWGLGVGLPSKITALGGKFLWKDDKETPELLTSAFYYPEANKVIEFEVRPWITNDEGDARDKGGDVIGNIFYGSEGYLVVKRYNHYETFLGRKREPGPTATSDDPGPLHFANWIDAIRSRKAEMLNGPVQTAHESSALAHLANISFRVGRSLQFDPKSERFIDAPDADELLTRRYRKPFVVPEVV